MFNKKLSIKDCEIYSSKDKDYILIANFLAITTEDSLWQKEFTTGVINHTCFLKDTQNKWTNEYSSDYFDIIIKSFTKKQVLIYCPRSGIQSGYKLFSKKEHDIYLIDRQNGDVIKCIEVKKGLVNGVIYKKAIFLKFIDPEEIRRCEF